MATPAQLKALAKGRAKMAALRKKKATKKPTKKPVKKPVKKVVTKKKAAPKRKVAPKTFYVMTVHKGTKLIGYWDGKGWDSAANAAHLFGTVAALKKALPSAKRKTTLAYGIGYKSVKKANAGTRKSNPVPASKSLKAKNAIALWEDFTGHKADYYQNINVDWPDVGLQVGDCDGILYSTVRDGVAEQYIHKFKKSARPVLAASHDGASLALIGGKFRFTNRGIVDN